VENSESKSKKIIPINLDGCIIEYPTRTHNSEMKQINRSVQICFLVFLIGCDNRKPESSFDGKYFNMQAKESFFQNREKYDLRSMNEMEKCVLEKTIANELDDLNDWRTAIIDSFYVRRYFLYSINTDFSFARTIRGDFYFIAIPRLNDYLLHDFTCMHPYYDCVRDGTIRLKDSVELAVSKINSTMLDEFFKKEVHHSRPLKQQREESVRLFHEFFPHMMLDHISWEMLIEELANEPEPNRTYIGNFLDPLAMREPMITGNVDCLIYKYEPFGWLFYDFYVDAGNSARISLDIYFIAHKNSEKLSYALGHEERECMSLDPLPIPKKTVYIE
jgi:hypothetical protein